MGIAIFSSGMHIAIDQASFWEDSDASISYDYLKIFPITQRKIIEIKTKRVGRDIKFKFDGSKIRLDLWNGEKIAM